MYVIVYSALLISVRNAGNIVPHSQHFIDELTMCEPAALELGCVVNDIRHVIVCGHSDCKAMNLLYALRDEEFASQVRLIDFLIHHIILNIRSTLVNCSKKNSDI